MIRGDLTAQSIKAREQFQSTEDDTFGDEHVRVNLMLPDKKTICKYFPLTENVNTLLIEF